MDIFAGLLQQQAFALTGQMQPRSSGSHALRMVLPRTSRSLEVERIFSSYQTPWLARFYTTAKFEESSPPRRSWVGLAVGFLASGALAAIVLVQARGRGRAEALLAQLRSSQTELRRSMEDRQRLNRDLHDNTIQRIYAAHIGLQRAGRWLREFARNSGAPAVTGASARGELIAEAGVVPVGARGNGVSRLATTGPLIEKSVAEVADSQKALGHINDELRQMLWQMEPVVLQGEALEQSLRKLINGIQPYTPAQITLEMTGALDSLPDNARHHVVSLTREAVTNAWRHGEATRVRVTLNVAEVATLTVEDDGRGFDPEAGRAGGRGLGNMRERVEELKGSFELRSQVGGPTVVRASWLVYEH
jgi:signal transduction histidine kinase